MHSTRGFFLFLVIVVLAGAGYVAFRPKQSYVPDPNSPIVHLTASNFDAAISGASTPVLVDFWASWCPPCRALEPTLDAIAKEHQGKAVIAKVNVDNEPGLAKRFGVQSIPTMIIFRDGKEAERLLGNKPKEAITQKLLPAGA